MSENTRNRLADEQSPYLLQHKDNPVHWQPWDAIAFQRARDENKPIFLSIGYSTCHWCHVMEHESFENHEVAEILNERFISIKVDREERPDVDRLYMSFVQATTGQGGWPLSAWLTPELKPFAGGTYFPPEDRYGRPGFKSVLDKIATAWREEPDKLEEHGNRVVAALQTAESQRQVGMELSPDWVDQTFRRMLSEYDEREGGFGNAPKFPRPSLFHFLFRYANRPETPVSERVKAKEMAFHSLRAMARGGMCDQIGGGFHRYSVDERWHVPHFEKMLYDQAQLLDAFTEAFQMSGDEEFGRVARDIAAYVLRDLRSPEGGFYSAEDADSLPDPGASRKLEGAFYVWKATELRRLLSPEESELVCDLYGVEEKGNVRAESDPHGELTGQNVLFLKQTIENWVKDNGKTVEEAGKLLEQARKKVFSEREKRPRPHLDDKIITSWNGLMIAALARAGQILNETEYIGAAREAAAFVKKHLKDSGQNVLYRSYRTSRGAVEGFADDYACYISGLLALYETTGELDFLVEARTMQAAMEKRFWDGGKGGFFSAPDGSGDLLIRMKEDHDGAEPSPNSIAFENLIRLADLLKESGLREHAEHGLIAFASQMESMGYAVPRMVAAFIWLQIPPRQVVFSGKPDSKEVSDLRRVLSDVYDPFRVVAYGVPKADLPAPEESWKALSFFASGQPAAAVCQNFTCLEPVSDPAKLRQQLESR